MKAVSGKGSNEQSVTIQAGGAGLEGDLSVPVDARGVVLFAHGSGSSRHSSRNRYVAQVLRDAGLATLLADLLTPDVSGFDAAIGRTYAELGLEARSMHKCQGTSQLLLLPGQSQNRTYRSASTLPTPVASNRNQFTLLMSPNAGILAAFTATK